MASTPAPSALKSNKPLAIIPSTSSLNQSEDEIVTDREAAPPPKSVTACQKQNQDRFFARFSPNNSIARLMFHTMAIGSHISRYPPHYYKDFYRLAFNNKKGIIRAGWVIGTGHYESQIPGVDIQLCPQSNAGSWSDFHEHIARKHAIISVHPISGVFMITNYTTKPIVCTGCNADGKTTTPAYTIVQGESSCSATYVLHRRRTRLDFGPFSFKLEFEDFRNEEEFPDQRARYIRVDPKSLPFQLIDPFALLDGNKKIDPKSVAIFSDISGSLTGGVRLTTGQPHVVKHSVIDSDNRCRMKEHRLMLAFSKQSSQELVGVECSLHQEPQGSTATYTMDMAMFSFYSYFSNRDKAFDTAEFFNYALSSLKGLNVLHVKGTPHGNINPHTILLLPDQQDKDSNKLAMRAAICPIVKPMTQGRGQNHCFFKPGRSVMQFSLEADVWALGATWLWCLTADSSFTEPERGRVTKAIMLGHDVDGLKRAIGDEFVSMIKVMLSSDSSKPTTCQDLISDPFWINNNRAKRTEPRTRKRKAENDLRGRLR